MNVYAAGKGPWPEIWNGAAGKMGCSWPTLVVSGVDEDEEKKKMEWRAQAKKELDEWQRHYQEQIELTNQRNKYPYFAHPTSLSLFSNFPNFLTPVRFAIFFHHPDILAFLEAWMEYD